MPNKLNRHATAYQQNMADLQKGANKSGSLFAPAPVAAPAAPVDNVPLGEMADIENSVAAQQAANAADPSIQDKLNKVAAQRAKFYGEVK